MGYDPCTLAFSFPPYPKGGTSLRGHPKPWSFSRALYALEPWIGVDIWHVDPERRVEGQRRDDSCGWFDRRPHEYAQAVRDILADAGEVQALRNAFDRATHQPAGYSTGWKRMTPADCLAACLMVAMRLEHLRCWQLKREGRWFVRSRYAATMALATNLALNETDNLQTSDDPESFVLSIASTLHRHYRPWWRHPRWHVHHWRVRFSLARNLKRMVQPCATCGKRLGFGYCPHGTGDGRHHHAECLGIRAAAAEPRA